jgi:cobalt-zinc-cadmium efflux system outer membrane protein
MYGRLITCFAWILSVALAVSTANRTEAASMENPSPSRFPAIHRTDLRSADDVSTPVMPPEPIGDIRLREALSLALMHNPELASFSIEVRAAEARTLQAGLRPNPELEVEVENFAGSGPLRGFDEAETTVQVGQLIELAGKRGKRTRLASLEHDLARWDYEAKRADVLADTRKAFLNVLASQDRLGLNQELLRLAEQTFETVSARVKAGKVSPIEETRAGVALANSRIEHARARRSLEAARKTLATAWGSGVPSFEKAVGDLDRVWPIPPVDQLSQEIRRNPDVARWAVEKEQRLAAVDLQEALRIPDPTLAGGIRHFQESDERAFTASISVPLPLFDRNQGGVLEARQVLDKSERERAAAVSRAHAALAETVRDLTIAQAEIESLKSSIIPGAQTAFESAGEGYRLGKFGFLDVLDAQRTLFEAKGMYVDALAAYHKGIADLERITGPGVIPDSIPSRGSEDR